MDPLIQLNSPSKSQPVPPKSQPVPQPKISRKKVYFEIGMELFLVVSLIALIPLCPWQFLRNNQSIVAASLFLYVPILFARKHLLTTEIDFGSLRPTWNGLLYYLIASALIFPLFVGVSYFVWHLERNGESNDPLKSLVLLVFGPPRATHFHIALPPFIGMKILIELLLIALPEEFFFRGFIQTKLSQVQSKTVAIVSTSLLFAMTHLITLHQIQSLLVFFPSLLFGWLRFKTNSLMASILFHASCNIFSYLVRVWFFS